jgi:hypothetical protein
MCKEGDSHTCRREEEETHLKHISPVSVMLGCQILVKHFTLGGCNRARKRSGWWFLQITPECKAFPSASGHHSEACSACALTHQAQIILHAAHVTYAEAHMHAAPPRALNHTSTSLGSCNLQCWWQGPGHRAVSGRDYAALRGESHVLPDPISTKSSDHFAPKVTEPWLTTIAPCKNGPSPWLDISADASITYIS